MRSPGVRLCHKGRHVGRFAVAAPRLATVGAPPVYSSGGASMRSARVRATPPRMAVAPRSLLPVIGSPSVAQAMSIARTRQDVGVHRRAQVADLLHCRVPDQVRHVEREHRREDDGAPGHPGDAGPIGRAEIPHAERHVEHGADGHRQPRDHHGRMALEQRPRGDGVNGPADDRAHRQQIAQRRPAGHGRAAPHQQVDPADRQHGTGPMPAADPLVAERGGQQGYGDGRAAEDERTVRDGGVCDAPHPADLVHEVAHEAEAGHCQPLAPGQRPGIGAPGPWRGPARAAPAARRGNRPEEQQRGQDEAQAVEGEMRNLTEGRLDDAVVGGPDDRDDEQQPVGRREDRATGLHMMAVRGEAGGGSRVTRRLPWDRACCPKASGYPPNGFRKNRISEISST